MVENCGAFFTTITIPMIEEGSKFISILFGCPTLWFYTILLSLYEFANYTLIFYSKTGNIELSFFVIRAIVIAVHITAVIIQIIGFGIWKQSGKLKYVIYGFLAAYGLHLGWNCFLSSFIYICLQKILD